MFFAALLHASPAYPGDTLHIIELKHRPAADIAPAVRPLLRADEALSAVDYRLIVRATDARAKEIENLARQLDVARRQLTITVRQTTAEEAARSRQDVRGEVDVGNRGRIVLPGGNEDNRRGTVGRRDGLEYRAESRSNTSRGERVQILRVQDGSPAYIRAGQSIAHVERILSLSGGRAVVSDGIALQDVTTGFEVRPQVRGDVVRLDITPRLATAADPARGLVNFQELRTTVSVRLGEWVDLGQVLGARSDIDRAILESGSARAEERATIWLKVE